MEPEASLPCSPDIDVKRKQPTLTSGNFLPIRRSAIYYA